MVDTQPGSIKKALYANLILLYFFVFMFSSNSPLLLWLAAASFFIFLGRTIFLIYVNERFSSFATQFYAGIILSFTVMSMGGTYTVSKNEFNQSAIAAAFWGGIPLLLVAIELIIIILTRFNPESLPFKPHEGRVITEHQNYNVHSGLIAGVATLISGIMLKVIGAASTGLLVSFLLTTLTLYLQFHYRHPIRGLMILLKKERNSTSFTFANIEEIREARSKWWLSQLFKWMAALRKKQGN